VTGIIGGFAVGIVVLVVALKWLFEGSRSTTEEPEIDYDELAQAEEEVRNLDGSVTPDDADDHLTDWGPGAPRQGT